MLPHHQRYPHSRLFEKRVLQGAGCLNNFDLRVSWPLLHLLRIHYLPDRINNGEGPVKVRVDEQVADIAGRYAEDEPLVFLLEQFPRVNKRAEPAAVKELDGAQVNDDALDRAISEILELFVDLDGVCAFDLALDFKDGCMRCFLDADFHSHTQSPCGCGYWVSARLQK
jgi:hypothetical protein